MRIQSVTSTPAQSSSRQTARQGWAIAMIVPALVILPATLLARGGNSRDNSRLQTLQPQVSYAKRALQGFNMRYWISNQMCIGQEAWDGNIQSQTPPYGLEYPVGSGIEHMFGAGPWIGAIVDGWRHVSMGYNGYNAAKYIRPDPRHPLRERIWKTSLKDSVTAPNRLGYDDDGDGLIDEDELDDLDNDGDWNVATDDVGSDGIPDSLEVGCRGGYDTVSNPDPNFDNYEPTKTDSCRPDVFGNYRKKDDPDAFTEKNGIPDNGEPNVDEDYGAMSDNDLFCSARDDNDPPIGRSPMGVRVTQKSYAWQSGTSADAISILEYSFQNVSTGTWRDAYFAFFADADVGPVNGSYFYRNYSCYFDTLRTAYIHNPIDVGSTPVGIALLGTPKPLDELKLVFKWWTFSSLPWGQEDSMQYGWMSGEQYPDDLIDSCQSEEALGDTRFLLSVGPFDSVSPGNEVTVVYALVSGETIDEMAVNAARALRIYEADGFISPGVRIDDAGAGSVTIAWTPAQSPFGPVTSYRLYYGTSPGVYSDSIETTSLSVDLTGLQDSLINYFAVVGFDEQGNRGAVSDELSTVPQAPRGLVVTGEQRSTHLLWKKNSTPNLLGYNVYRTSDQETLLVRLNSLPVPDTMFVDTAVLGSRAYHYRITAVSIPGFESPLSVGQGGRLIPPAIPNRFVVGPGTDFVRLEWDQNVEDDFAGYNVYRIEAGDTVILNTGLLPAPGYTDSTVVPAVAYVYFIESVDSTGATARTTALAGYTVVPDRGVLAVVDVCDPVPLDNAIAFTKALLTGFQDSVRFLFPILYHSSPLNSLSRFSTVIWISDCQLPRSYQYPLALKGYVAGGGHLLIIGPGITTKSYPYHYQFLAELFGITPFLGIDTTPDFAGAIGTNGFPPVAIDSAKLAFLGGRANLVETFDNIPPERVFYSYMSDPVDTAREGKAVGIRAVRDDRMAYYFSFPLYYLDSSDATALIRKVLNDFGEVLVDVAGVDGEIPARFYLYDAYPNPFNPSTTIRFDVPVRSRIRLSLYDVLGRELDPLFDDDLPPGRHEVRWDASGMATGMYYVRLRVSGVAGGDVAGSDLRKLLLVK